MHATTQVAIQAFFEEQRASLLLEKKRKQLSEAVNLMANEAPPEDRPVYLEETGKIIEDFEAKAEKAGV